jgi:SAM-dependent methyltransferase
MQKRNCLEDPQATGVTPSTQDKIYWNHLREFVKEFLLDCATKYAPLASPNSKLLEIGPQTYETSNPFRILSANFINMETLDIVPGNTYCADITKTNSDTIPDASFDYIICTEVLEHTTQPFDAVKELHRMLKPNGLLFFSVPCNFRIHGPLPDCWRFTQWGLQKSLFHPSQWTWKSLIALDDPARPLFPLDYAGVVSKL